ncbi:unnamed protein product [Rhizophagus irregularis]|uniref:MATA-HMG n=1 Tax=Rhizophagus irregularis TaxID=588596 RepID=A0A1B1ETN7_9GLOM|nr:MATA-HMG [Rhizophagus irregularis]PKK67221.1 hypothetical protein RhiirC2_783797 [Rhizophagus irregularis]CAB4381685.1 unnamed protein product [Rhizophagus irregularis]CAB5314033.1 unnamed protein product [Rhizophagus irregularis]
MNVKKSTKYEIPLFKVPFPPELSVGEILGSRSEDKLKSRAPNGYLIYRLAFLKELRKRTDDILSMTKISSHISSMWFNEKTAVRDAYKKLSEDVENRLTEIRQKEKLIIVDESFSPDLQDNNSSSGIAEYNNVSSPSHIPILSDPSYQLYDSPYPLSLQQSPFPSEITVNVDPSYIQIPNFNHPYQHFIPEDDFFNINHFYIDSCSCEICCYNFIKYGQF